MNTMYQIEFWIDNSGGSCEYYNYSRIFFIDELYDLKTLVKKYHKDLKKNTWNSVSGIKRSQKGGYYIEEINDTYETVTLTHCFDISKELHIYRPTIEFATKLRTNSCPQEDGYCVRDNLKSWRQHLEDSLDDSSE